MNAVTARELLALLLFFVGHEDEFSWNTWLYVTRYMLKMCQSNVAQSFENIELLLYDCFARIRLNAYFLSNQSASIS